MRANRTFVRITSYGFHNAAIDSKGLLFTWGENNDYCLGHNNCKDYNNPVCVEALSNQQIVDIGCGDDFTCIITCDKSHPLRIKNMKIRYEQHANNAFKLTTKIGKYASIHNKILLEKREEKFLFEDIVSKDENYNEFKKKTQNKELIKLEMSKVKPMNSSSDEEEEGKKEQQKTFKGILNKKEKKCFPADISGYVLLEEIYDHEINMIFDEHKKTSRIKDSDLIQQMKERLDHQNQHQREEKNQFKKPIRKIKSMSMGQSMSIDRPNTASTIQQSQLQPIKEQSFQSANKSNNLNKNILQDYYSDVTISQGMKSPSGMQTPNQSMGLSPRTPFGNDFMFFTPNSTIEFSRREVQKLDKSALNYSRTHKYSSICLSDNTKEDLFLDKHSRAHANVMKHQQNRVHQRNRQLERRQTIQLNKAQIELIRKQKIEDIKHQIYLKSDDNKKKIEQKRLKKQAQDQKHLNWMIYLNMENIVQFFAGFAQQAALLRYEGVLKKRAAKIVQRFFWKIWARSKIAAIPQHSLISLLRAIRKWKARRLLGKRARAIEFLNDYFRIQNIKNKLKIAIIKTKNKIQGIQAYVIEAYKQVQFQRKLISIVFDMQMLHLSEQQHIHTKGADKFIESRKIELQRLVKALGIQSKTITHVDDLDQVDEDHQDYQKIQLLRKKSMIDFSKWVMSGDIELVDQFNSDKDLTILQVIDKRIEKFSKLANVVDELNFGAGITEENEEDELRLEMHHSDYNLHHKELINGLDLTEKQNAEWKKITEKDRVKSYYEDNFEGAPTPKKQIKHKLTQEEKDLAKERAHQAQMNQTFLEKQKIKHYEQAKESKCKHNNDPTITVETNEDDIMDEKDYHRIQQSHRNTKLVQLDALHKNIEEFIAEDSILPYSIHNDDLKMPIDFFINVSTFKRIQLSPALTQKLIDTEVLCKKKILEEVLIKSRKRYQRDLEKFEDNINDFIIKNQAQISQERAHIMLQIGPKKLKANEKVEEEHRKMKAKSLGIDPSLTNYINTSKLGNAYDDPDYQIDNLKDHKQHKGTNREDYKEVGIQHLPFKDLVVKIAERMENAPKRPQYKIYLTNIEFKQAIRKYYDIMREHINKLNQHQ